MARRGHGAVRAYVDSLGEEAHEWLLALFVDDNLQLLAVDTLARGDVGGVLVPIQRIIVHACQLKAAAFLLVHNHPSGICEASSADLSATRKLVRLGDDMGIPMLEHLIVTKDGMKSVGFF